MPEPHSLLKCFHVRNVTKRLLGHALLLAILLTSIIMPVSVWAAETPVQRIAGAVPSISGTVTDSATGSPLSNIPVLIADAAGAWVAGMDTDANGDYASRHDLPAGTYYVYTAELSGYNNEIYNNVSCGTYCQNKTSGTPVIVTEGVETSGIDFALEFMASIAGTVTDADTGLPLAGISVGLYDSAGNSQSSIGTKANGTYLLYYNISPGTYYVIATHGDYQNEVYKDLPCTQFCDNVTDGTPLVIAAGDRVTDIDFSLEEAGGGAISGTVTDVDTGLGINPLQLSVYDDAGEWVMYVYTDANGDFSTPFSLPAGDYHITTTNSLNYIDELYDNELCIRFCEPTDGTPISVSAGLETTGIDFELTLGGSVSGMVTDVLTANGIDAANVHIYDGNGERGASARADAAGAYQTETGLPTGTYYAVAVKTGYFNELYDDVPCVGNCFPIDTNTATSFQVTEGINTPDIDFAMDPVGTISGTVTDAQSTLAIPGARLTLYNDSGEWAAEKTAEADGTFSISGLRPGTFYLLAEADGYTGEVHADLRCVRGGPLACTPTDGTPITVLSGQTTSGVDFALDNLGSFSGTVTDLASGLPMNGVMVSIYEAGGSWIGQGFTDANGDYTPQYDLPPGDYYAKADPVGYWGELYDNLPCEGICTVTVGTPITVSPNQVTPGIDFALGLEGSISGTITAAGTGQPLDNAGVVVYDQAGEVVKFVRTGPDGFYSAGPLGNGTYHVRTQREGALLAKLYDDIDCLPGDGCVLSDGTPVAVTNGPTTGIDFSLETGHRISGTVTEALSGALLADVSVEIFLADGTFLTGGLTNASGFYTIFDALPPGTYYARAFNSAGYLWFAYEDLWCPVGQECDLTQGTPIVLDGAGDATGIDFALETGGRVSGNVTDDATGLPVEGARVAIFDAANRELSYATTDANGDYLTPIRLATGAYYLRTYQSQDHFAELYDGQTCKPGCTPADGTPVSVSDGVETQNIDFTLKGLRLPPGPPVIYSATPGDGSATINFGPPASDGGRPITGYTATCTPGPFAAAGGSPPLTVLGLNNNQLYSCSVTATNEVGTSEPSATLSVIPGANSNADLSITKSNGSGSVSESAPTTYTIEASNAGPAGVVGARVTDHLGPDFTSATWTCVGLAGGRCDASGAGDIDTLVDLPAGGKVRFRLTVMVAPGTEGPVSNIAEVEAPAGITDGTPANNQAVDGPDEVAIFVNGFE